MIAKRWSFRDSEADPPDELLSSGSDLRSSRSDPPLHTRRGPGSRCTNSLKNSKGSAHAADPIFNTAIPASADRSEGGGHP